MHRTSRGSLLPLCEYPKINNMTWRETILLGITLAFVALILSVAPGKAPITEDAYETAETPGTFEATTTVAFFPEAEVAPPPKVQVIHTPEPAEQIPVVQQAPPPPADNEESSGVSRLENPYPFAPLPEETLNANARAALIHILCIVNGDQSVSGSGVLIDARGVVLTNAHVGQFVLLSEVSSNITCTARTGTPAKAAWKMRTLYMPSTWVDEHAQDLRSPQPKGTGEHDYALFLLEPLPDTPRPPAVPMLYDVREAVSFEGDSVLLASYPAGFVGAQIIQSGLYPVTTFTNLGTIYTFEENSIDVLSLGGVIVAQGGSSGGAVVNRWGRLVGIIVTTSEGKTTAERDLRAITLAHIDRSMRGHTELGLREFLDGDILTHANDFRVTHLSDLAQKLIDQIPQH